MECCLWTSANVFIFFLMIAVSGGRKCWPFSLCCLAWWLGCGEAAFWRSHQAARYHVYCSQVWRHPRNGIPSHLRGRGHSRLWQHHEPEEGGEECLLLLPEQVRSQSSKLKVFIRVLETHVAWGYLPRVHNDLASFTTCLSWNQCLINWSSLKF